MSNKAEPEILGTIGQRIRLHSLNCDWHVHSKLPPYTKDVWQYTEFPNLDYFIEHPQQIFGELKYSKYIPYASIIIIINIDCTCGTRLLNTVLHNMAFNRHLRYKTKFILSGYIDDRYTGMLRHLKVKQLILDTKYENRPQSECLMASPLKGELFPSFPFPLNLTYVLYGSTLLLDHNIFRHENLDNTFFIQDIVEEPDDLENDLKQMLYFLSLSPFVSLKEFFVARRGAFIAQDTGGSDIYFYNINPALAIIINNYYFTSNLGVREGSDHDVRHLMRVLKVAQIPFILFQDISREELLQKVDYILRKNFHPLKKFMFVLMSHGDANNVIYTHDGQLDLIEDIVKPIQSNRSLDNAEKVFIANACRGSIDMEYGDRRDLAQIPRANTSPDNSFLCDKTVILRSVPELVRSPRDSQWGSPFMQSFCQNFRHIDHTQDIYFVHQLIENDLEEEAYYEYLETRSDLAVGNDTGRHHLISYHINAQEMIRLIESIRDDFSVIQDENRIKNANSEAEWHQAKSLFCICGSLKKAADSCSEIFFKERYFSKDLDADCCDIEEVTRANNEQ